MSSAAAPAVTAAPARPRDGRPQPAASSLGRQADSKPQQQRGRLVKLDAASKPSLTASCGSALQGPSKPKPSSLKPAARQQQQQPRASTLVRGGSGSGSGSGSGLKRKAAGPALTTEASRPNKRPVSQQQPSRLPPQQQQQQQWKLSTAERRSQDAQRGIPAGGLGSREWHIFREGQVVWAKMASFPAWPAQVSFLSTGGLCNILYPCIISSTHPFFTTSIAASSNSLCASQYVLDALRPIFSPVSCV